MKFNALILTLIIAATSFLAAFVPNENSTSLIPSDGIGEFSGRPYTELNGNVPYFSLDDYPAYSFEEYSELDFLNRCGVCVANIGPDLLPTEERGYIGSVKPSGWKSEKYDFVDGKYLYNRCHLIGYQLTGENANERNLITGTRYMNVQGMLPFENMIANYVKKTGNNVLLRVTPVFEGENALASGVIMEAMSTADNGKGICFNVYCYNVQPGVIIDYATGESFEEFKELVAGEQKAQSQSDYILNIKSKKVHIPACTGAKKIKNENKETFRGYLKDLLTKGYTACGSCNPQ